MKKTYIIPQTESHRIHVEQMLALSTDSVTKAVEDPSDASLEGGIMNTREYQDWDIWGDAE